MEPLSAPVAKWAVSDVAVWLRANNLARYADAFADCDVDGLTLLQICNEQDVSELGVLLRVHQRKIVSLVGELQSHVVAPESAVSNQDKPGESIVVELPIYPSTGLGLELAESRTGECVVATITSAKASTQNIKEGDVITSVDTIDVSGGTGYQFEDIVSVLRAKVKSQKSTLALGLFRSRDGGSLLIDDDEAADLHGATPREEDMLGSPYSYTFDEPHRTGIISHDGFVGPNRQELNALRDALPEHVDSTPPRFYLHLTAYCTMTF